MEAELLLLVGDREPVLDQDDAGAHEHALELGHRAEELLALSSRAEAHDALDAGAVVPAAVEQHDLAGRRQMRHVALEVPLRALALGGRRQRDDAADARIEALRDALDDAALAGGIAPLEDHDDLELLVPTQSCSFTSSSLQPEQLAEIDLAIDSAGSGRLRRLRPAARSSRSSSISISSSSSKLSAISALMRSELVLIVRNHGGYPVEAPPTERTFATRV